MNNADRLIRALALMNTCLFRGEDVDKIHEAKGIIASVIASEKQKKGEDA